MYRENNPEGSMPSLAIGGDSQRPSPNALPAHGSIYEGQPRNVNFGPVYNITAGNVFTGVNYGSVTMISDSDEFMLNLATRLKVSVKADHKYYASGDEKSLRRSSCTPGTRVLIIELIIQWATDMLLDGEFVFWLSGQAGAGKTTIAYTICHRFDTLISQGNSKVILGGSFFCSRQFPDTRSVSSIIRTIVYQLALRSKPFRNALKEHGRFETVDHGPKSQFMGLLVEPWRESAPGRLAEEEPCYVIPIDALDELEGNGGTEFLGTLFDILEKGDLSGLKFIVTSRSDPALVKRVTSFSNKQVCRLEAVPLEESSADIELYLNENLAECATTQQIRQLVSDAAGLFIHAATVVEYVKGRDVEEQRSILRRLLSASSRPSPRASRGATATLDSLYLQILESSLVDPRDSDDPDAFQDCLSILHTFLCTIERTSITVAVNILNASVDDSDTVLDTGMAKGVLRRLHAILYSDDGLIMSFHKSFTDFLFDKSRSQRFYCDREKHHRRLADGCFGIMAKQLKFNIANIPSSYRLDRDNLALSESIETNISRPLRYACANWSAHLILTSHEVPNRLAESIGKFLQLRILLWIESMGLLGQRGRCQSMLRDTQQWCSKIKSSAELISKLADAAAFAAYHSTSKAALSTLHLYLSSLATFRQHSTLVQTWRRQFGGIPRFINIQGVGGKALVANIPVGNKVSALAVSPNSVNIAIGSPEGLVQIWDLSTGEEIGSLKGHTAHVWAVAYSPDGTSVTSASSDKSIRVWDLSKSMKAKALHGHTEAVMTVAYSPDGTRIVSGSCDKSTRVWDMSTGDVRAIKSHSEDIFAVAYCHDGMHVVFGSRDNSIRVWDTSSGEEIRAFHGHADVVWVLACLPDGSRVVSGSWDNSVRVWDLATGEEMRAFKGHTNFVCALAYSPDGTHIVSSSMDQSIRVWDLSTGEEVNVLKGHTAHVWGVGYSPDGTHVISASFDKSVRVWDPCTTVEGRLLEGHTSKVNAVAFSPDGTHIISGSDDKTVRLWNLSTGEEVKYLKGHVGAVITVAYSPDGVHVTSGSSDESIRLWNLSTGEEERVFKGHTDLVWTLVYSLDGNHVVSGSWDNSIRVWDPRTGAEVTILKGHSKGVLAVAYCSDGIHVVSGSMDKSIRVWDTSTGEETRAFYGHTEAVSAIACSPEGTYVVSSSWDKSVRVWDLSTGEEVRAFKGHTSSVPAVAYSPNGAYAVFGSSETSVRIWNLSTGQAVGILKGHTKRIGAVAYSPDGTRIVSGSDDCSVRVWAVSPHHSPRYIPQKGPDGENTGWILSPTNPPLPLMFIPPEALLPDDCNILTFPGSAVPYLDLSRAKIGDRWTKCFTPMLL